MNDLELIVLLGKGHEFRSLGEDYIECPKCHNKYDPVVLINESFRTITDDNGRNKKKICEDCYWKWVGRDDDNVLSRYCNSIEETGEGLVYVKGLGC